MTFEAVTGTGTAEAEVNSSTVFAPEELVDYETGNIKDAELIQAGERKYQEVMANPDYGTWADDAKAKLAEAQKIPAMKKEVYNRAYADAVGQAASAEEATKMATDAAQAFVDYQFSAAGRAAQAAINASPESRAV